MGNAFCFFSVLILIGLFVFLLWRNSQDSPTSNKYPYVAPQDTDPVRRNLGVGVTVTTTPRPPPPPAPFVAEYERIKNEVAALKRDENYDVALNLLHQSLESLEQNRLPHFSPWPYEQAAIIYRKRKQHQDELEILQRYFRQTDVYPTGQALKLAQRFPKTCKLAGVEIDTTPFIRLGLAVDLETTGLYERDEIIEFAAVLFAYSLLTGEILEVVTEYSGFREPKRPIPKSATRVHGLRDSDVKGHYLDEGNIKALWNRAHVIVAHNASFEEKFINSLYPWTKGSFWLCSMNGVNWQRKGHKSRSLQNLIKDCNIVDGNAHRALADVHHMLSLLKLRDQDGRQFFSELLTVG